MTGARAIELLKGIQFCCDFDDCTNAWDCDECVDAFNMAIEALEQEPCDKRTDKRTETHACDCISRQAAIEAICEDGTMFERQGQYSITMAERKQRDTDILDALPSAQPFTEEQIQTMQELEAAQIEKAYELGKADRPKWIPVTERLAEFPCIIQDANGNNPSVPSGIVTVESKEHGTWQIDGKFWTDKDLNPYLNWHNRIIAWQPLPEPYEESDE